MSTPAGPPAPADAILNELGEAICTCTQFELCPLHRVSWTSGRTVNLTDTSTSMGGEVSYLTDDVDPDNHP